MQRYNNKDVLFLL